MKEAIYIKENKISIGRYLRYAMELYLRAKWWLYALPLFVCLCLSVINIKFLYVAIILLFLVFTMILFIIEVHYGLVPESRFSTMNKRIKLIEDGLLIYMKDKIDAEEDTSNEKNDEQILISWNMFCGIVAKDNHFLLLFRKPKFSFIVLPYSAFDDVNHLLRVVLFINSKI